MPTVSAEADMTTGDRDIARAAALDVLDGARWEGLPPRLRRLMCQAIVRYVPGGVPDAPAPTAVAAADDQTRRAVAPYSGSPALDFPAPGVICEPIDEGDSSGVCEVSDDASTSQNRLNFTAAYDAAVHDTTRK
jgi:hypothetical protein